MNYIKKNQNITEFLETLLSWDSVIESPKAIENQFSHQKPLKFKETENDITLVINVPGFDKKQLDIFNQGTTLIVSGKKSKDLNAFGYNIHLSNQFQFDKINATAKNGQPIITIPKKEAEKRQLIKIN